MLELIISFVLAFLLTYLSLPSMIKIAKIQGMVDKPDDRKSHKYVTPSFGGISIFAGFFLVVMVWTPVYSFGEIRYILCALVIVFLVGAMDDLDPISPWSKLLGQLIASGFLIFLADVRISSLYGLFGIYEIPLVVGIVASFVLFIFVINSFNLIDGINGLSSSITILVSTFLGLWFFMVGHFEYAVIALTTAGSCLAFLKYNITPAKIFMGDTGSLVLGTICAILIVQFLEINVTLSNRLHAFDSGLSLAMGLLILPVFDTIRVFVIRIIKGKSPFSPDKAHIHHLLLDMGLSHMQATGILLVVNIGFIIAAMNMQELKPIVFIGTSLALAFVLSMILSITVQSKKRGMVRS